MKRTGFVYATNQPTNKEKNIKKNCCFVSVTIKFLSLSLETKKINRNPSISSKQAHTMMSNGLLKLFAILAIATGGAFGADEDPVSTVSFNLN